MSQIDDIRSAIEVLQRSERGRAVGANLLRFLDEGASSLDQSGKGAVCDLLSQAWNHGNAGEVLWSLDAAFGARADT